MVFSIVRDILTAIGGIAVAYAVFRTLVGRCALRRDADKDVLYSNSRTCLNSLLSTPKRRAKLFVLALAVALHLVPAPRVVFAKSSARASFRRAWRQGASSSRGGAAVAGDSGGVGVRGAAADAGDVDDVFANQIGGPCFDDPRLWACRAWLTETLPSRRVDIVLVGNELWQQFPLMGYGGIETTVEATAWAMHRMRIPFWVLTPGRGAMRQEGAEQMLHLLDYPFDVLETPLGPNGRGGLTREFCKQGIEVATARADIVGGNLSRVDVAHELVGSARASAPPAPRELVVWGQSDWSQGFSEIPGAIATIASHHDGNGAISGWDRQLPCVGHRFLCNNQRRQWISDGDNVNLARSRIIGHGLPLDDFDICEDGRYFLWVATLDWGWEEKGLQIFINMARIDPNMTYVIYGGAARRKDIVAKIVDLTKELPNLVYRGELLRGDEHFRAFCEATAFFMPTQLGESFGMTVIEALSKGVPVITSTFGAPADILRIPGRKGFSPYGAACQHMWEYKEAADRFRYRSRNDSLAIQAFARAHFENFAIVEALLRFSYDVMGWGKANGPRDPLEPTASDILGARLAPKFATPIANTTWTY